MGATESDAKGTLRRVRLKEKLLAALVNLSLCVGFCCVLVFMVSTHWISNAFKNRPGSVIGLMVLAAVLFFLFLFAANGLRYRYTVTQALRSRLEDRERIDMGHGPTS